MFGFKKKDKLTWEKLTDEQKKHFTSSVVKHYKALARYKVVSGFDQTQRERGIVENKGEDQILDNCKRKKLINLIRNQARNSSAFNTLLKQIQENVVGTSGGKIIVDFEDNEEVAAKLRRLFRDYTRDADFFNSLSLNQCLRIILNTEIINGETLIVIDDGLIEDSGKILIFEPDEIVTVSNDAIQKHYGKGAYQIDGKVKNANGRWIGTVVSKSQRGLEVADPKQCYFLKRNPDASYLDSMWMQMTNVYRTNQTFGISPMAASVGAMEDLENLTNFELQKAKKASQSFAQIYSTKEREEVAMPSAFDSDTDFSQMTDDEIKAAVAAETEEDEVVNMEQTRAAGILFQQLPEGYKMESLQVGSPNTDVIEFVRWLCGRTSSAMGLSQVFATLSPDGNNFRSEQLLSQPTFEYYKKRLETFLDWLIYRFVEYVDKKGMFDKSELPEGWLYQVQWDSPSMDELDENSHQDAISKKLKNMTSNYKQILGHDWKAKLMQTAKEIKWLKENGLPIPQFDMISGGEKTGADVEVEEIQEI